MTTELNGMQGCERCPQCHLVPMAKISLDSVVLVCEVHGHEAQGKDLEQAVEHWNHYIEFIKQEASR